MTDELLRRGILLFNNRQCFSCHEVLEEAWTVEAEPRRLFLQTLIHLAVGFYHSERGNPNWLSICRPARASTQRGRRGRVRVSADPRSHFIHRRFVMRLRTRVKMIFPGNVAALGAVRG